MSERRQRYVLLAAATLLAACGGSDRPTSAGAAGGIAKCAAMSDEGYVTRNELAPGQRSDSAQLLLRFVHFTDDHIIDDDGQARMVDVDSPRTSDTSLVE